MAWTGPRHVRRRARQRDADARRLPVDANRALQEPGMRRGGAAGAADLVGEKEGRSVALQLDAELNRAKAGDEKTVRFRVVGATTEEGLGFDPEPGAGGQCGLSNCGTVADSTYVKTEGKGAANRLSVDGRC